MIRKRWLLTALLAGLVPLQACTQESPDRSAAAEDRPQATAGEPAWVGELDAEVARIGQAMPGDFGVYVRRLGEDAGTVDHSHDRQWYLSSTVKVPVAIAVLERVDAGEIALDDEYTLAQTDFVDGAGDMLWHDPGERFTIATLLEKSIQDSDSTATDILLRMVGEDAFNDDLQRWVGDGFGPITTLLQVRYDAYGALHPDVAALSNMQIVALRNAGNGEARLVALAEALGVPRSELDAQDLDTVFGDYYDTGRNSGRLDTFGLLLEKLVAGELLSEASTDRLLGHMQRITTGGSRIQAGLPSGTGFAQKTGTQIARACNVGVLEPDRGADGATLVLACAEDYDDIAQAEQAFQSLGRALGDAGVAR